MGRHSKTCRSDLHSWSEVAVQVDDEGRLKILSQCGGCKRWLVENEAFPEDPFRIYEPHEIDLSVE